MAVSNIDLPVNLIQSEDYDLLAYEAQRIVEQVLQQSLNHIRETALEEEEEEEEDKTERRQFVELEKSQSEIESTVKWPKIAEFTNENVGIEKINEYIEKEWKTASGGPDACWLYAIDFIERKSLEFTNLYIYRVRFSIPTRRQPIPRHTASVYFTLDVSKIKPKNTPIQVSFVFETMRLIHTPDKFRFRQIWLENIILLKEKLSQGIDF